MAEEFRQIRNAQGSNDGRTTHMLGVGGPQNSRRLEKVVETGAFI